MKNIISFAAYLLGLFLMLPLLIAAALITLVIGLSMKWKRPIALVMLALGVISTMHAQTTQDVWQVETLNWSNLTRTIIYIDRIPGPVQIVTNNVPGPVTTNTIIITNCTPQPPTNIVVGATTSFLNVRWDDMSGDETGFKIERSISNALNFAQIATVPANVTAYINSNLVLGVTYCYRIRAYNSFGDSAYSDVACGIPTNAVPIPPPVTNAPPPVVTNTAGLVARYSFNEGTGTTVADSSGNNNTGTIGTATWTAGKYGNALLFNGTTAKVTVNDSASLHLTTAMTLEAWVKPVASVVAWKDVIEKGADDYYLMASSNNGGLPAAGGKFATSALFATSPLPVGVWTHLATTYDGTTQRFYVNGVQVSSRPLTGTIGVSTKPIQFGGDDTFGQFFTGAIDEVRIYNRALTAMEIQGDMGTP